MSRVTLCLKTTSQNCFCLVHVHTCVAERPWNGGWTPLKHLICLGFAFGETVYVTMLNLFARQIGLL